MYRRVMLEMFVAENITEVMQADILAHSGPHDGLPDIVLCNGRTFKIVPVNEYLPLDTTARPGHAIYDSGHDPALPLYRECTNTETVKIGRVLGGVMGRNVTKPIESPESLVI